jgi:Zinc knuckle
VPTPGHPVPMDIDAARRKPISDANCHRCGKPGHWSKNCPDRYDIRVMSNEEIEEELESRFARLDAVDEHPARLAEPTVTPAEDFSRDDE